MVFFKFKLIATHSRGNLGPFPKSQNLSIRNVFGISEKSTFFSGGFPTEDNNGTTLGASYTRLQHKILKNYNRIFYVQFFHFVNFGWLQNRTEKLRNKKLKWYVFDNPKSVPLQTFCPAGNGTYICFLEQRSFTRTLGINNP